MVFKTVDGHITNIFNKVDKLNTGFELTNDEIQGIVNRFNELNSTQNFGQEYTDFIAEMTNRNFNVSQMFDDISKRGASARASVKDFYAAILDGNTKGFANVKSTMALFNQAQQSGADNARDFAKAVGQSNTQLGGYLSTLGTNGTATLKGYAGYLVSATAKTIGLQAATFALNLAINALITGLGMLFVKGISLAINGIKNLANNVENTKEKVKNLTEEFDSALTSANNNAKKVEELADRYQQLSKGVNDLGENVALTNEEYTEYNSLVNEIADMFPELVRGYTNEGNAILNLKGNVEKLRDAYKETQKEAYNTLIITGKNGDGNDIIKQWQDTQDTNAWAKMFDLGDADVDHGISVNEAVKQLTEFRNMTAKRYKEIQEIYTAAYSEAEGLFDFDFANEYAIASGFDKINDTEYNILKDGYLRKALGLDDNLSSEDFDRARQQAKALIDTYEAEIENRLSSVSDLVDAYLHTNDNYESLNESSKKAASVIVNSLDENIANSLKTETDYSTFAQKIIDAFKDENVQNAANSLFNLDTSNMSVKDINAEVDRYIDIIAKAIGEDSDKLKIRLGFEDINDTLERAKSKFITRGMNSKEGQEVSDFLESLTSNELDAVMQIPDLFADGLEKASEKIQEFMADPNNKIGISFDYSSYSEQVDDIVKNVDKVQSALDKLNSGKGIDNKDITELANAFPDYSSKILSAADNTEKLKSVLGEIKSNAPSGLINTLRNLKDLSADDQDAVNGLIAILSNLNSAASNYADTLADLETKEGLLSTAYKEMHDDGQISLSTYQKLIDSGIDYSKAIENVNGKITVNSEKLKELTKEQYNLEIQTLRLTEAEIGHNIALNPKNYDLYKDQLQTVQDKITNLLEARDLLDAYDYTTTAKKDKDEKPQSVLDFEAEYAEKQHEINMGRMKEDEDYYSWLLSAAHTAYDGLADYQDDLWKYEEEVYKGRKQLADDFYDEQQKDLEDRISNLENDIEIATKYSTDSDDNKLNVEEKYDYISSAYQEIINELNTRIGEILDTGIEGHEEDVAKLEQQIIEYQEKLAELPKTAAEEEQTYIKKLKDDYSDLYDERIKKIKEQQDAAEKAAQAEIDAVQEKIDALKDANDKEQEALDIEKARQELEKASQSTRQVYGADGSISFKVDDEKVKEAQNNLDKLIQEQQINILEEQKDLLEQAKDKESEAYDSIIDNLETEKENSEKRFDILLDALDEYLNPDQGESNSDVWKELAHLEGATYKNGVWTDKDGKAINIDELINTVETAKKDDKQTNIATDTNTDNQSKTDSKSGKDEVVISGNLERVDIGDETSETQGKKSEEKVGSVIEAFFSSLEKKLGLKDGSLSLENAMQMFSGSNMEKYNPYASAISKSGMVANENYINNNKSNSISFNGDIVINNPVGNSDDLAKELMADLPNAFQKQMYSNLAK